MTTHHLKQAQEVFGPSLDGIKSFEIRKNDRDYQVGDVLILNEWNGTNYTGRSVAVKVTYILADDSYGMKDWHIIMAVKPLNWWDRLLLNWS